MAEDLRVEVQLGAVVDGFIRAMQRANQALEEFEKKTKEEKNALDDLEKKAAQTGAAINQMGAIAAAGFATLSAGITAAVYQFASFEQTLNKVQAVTGATADEMEALKAAAVDVGQKTQFSTGQAAEALLNLGKAGLTAKQAIDALPGVIDLAAASGENLANVTETTTGIMNGFGLAVGDTVKIADVLAAAANSSAVDVADLAESFKYVAPVGKAANQSFEEMSGVLAVLGNNMIKGGQAGTALRASLLRLQAPADESAKVMSAIGLNIADSEGKMKPFTTVIAELAEKTGKFNEISQNKIFEKIFGQEAVSAIAALVNEARKAPGALANTVTQMNNATGTAKRFGQVVGQGVKYEFDQMKGSLETVSAQFGELFAPAVNSALRSVTGLLSKISEMDPFYKQLIANGVLVAGAFLGSATAAYGFYKAAQAVKLILGAEGVMAVLSKLKAVLLMDVPAAFAASKAAAVGFATTSKTVLISMLPQIAAVAGAIGAITLAIYAAVEAWRALESEAQAYENMANQKVQSDRLRQQGALNRLAKDLDTAIQSGKGKDGQALSPAEIKALTAQRDKAVKQANMFSGLTGKQNKAEFQYFQKPKADGSGAGTATFTMPGDGGSGGASNAKQAGQDRLQYLEEVYQNESKMIAKAGDIASAAYKRQFEAGLISYGEYSAKRLELEEYVFEQQKKSLEAVVMLHANGTKERANAEANLNEFIQTYYARRQELAAEDEAFKKQVAERIRQNEYDIQRQGLQESLQLNQTRFNDGIIGAEEYFATLESLRKQDYEAEKKKLETELKEAGANELKKAEISGKLVLLSKNFNAQQVKDAQDKAKALTEIARTEAEGSLAHQKALIAQEQAELKAKLDFGKVSYVEYYARRQELDQKAHDAEVANLRAQLVGLDNKGNKYKQIANQIQALDNALKSRQIDNLNELTKVQTDQAKAAVNAISSIIANTGNLFNAVAAGLKNNGDNEGAKVFEEIGFAAQASGQMVGVFGSILSGDVAGAINGVVGLATNLVKRMFEINAENEKIRQFALNFQGFINSMDATPIRKAAEDVRKALDTPEFRNLTGAQIDRSIERKAAEIGAPVERLKQTLDLMKGIDANVKNLDKVEGILYQYNPAAVKDAGALDAMISDPNTDATGRKVAMQYKALKDRIAQQNKELQDLTGASIDGILSFAGDARGAIQGLNIPSEIKAQLQKQADQAEFEQLGKKIVQGISDPAELKKAEDRYRELFRQINYDENKKKLEDLFTNRFNEMSDWNEGEQDERGNRISKEAKLQADLADAKKNFDEGQARRDSQRKKLLESFNKQEIETTEKLTKLRENLSKLISDEAKKLQEIEDQGVAVRQKTVREVKDDQKQAVREEYEERRKSVNDQIKDLETASKERKDNNKEALEQLDNEDKRAKETYDNQTARLNNLYLQALAIHNAKMTNYDTEISKLRDVLGAEKLITDEIQRQAEAKARAARGGSGGSSGGGSSLSYGPGGAVNGTFTNSSGGTSTVTTVGGLIYVNGSIPGKATGGIVGVPGNGNGDTMPYMLQQGEYVINRRIAQMLISGSPGNVAPNETFVVQIDKFSGSDADYKRLEREMRRIAGERSRARGNYGTV